ncbi:type VI secretion system Vgr family protein [Chryseobacterium sp. MMS23-Vi53]|uniref:type VI secretion system Vgr family protein n=1 Tax=Chryseobacterium sp. MMS23-Vi53 TaxID=3386644 RepID=UPI0039E7B031
MDNMKLNDPEDIKKYFSSKTFKDFLTDKSSPLVYCTLSLEGKPFLDKSHFDLHLQQNTNDHDTFTITTPDDSLDSFEGYIMENSKNILGKKITINLHRFGEVKQMFTGIVANIKNKKENGYGKLLISGYSPSVLLENGQHCQSFENKNLDQIIKESTAEYPEDCKISIENPNTKHQIPYTVQYKESDYQFIKRLATRYGEYFYYNGQNLVFGNKVQPIITLEENIDLIDIEFELNIKPQSFTFLTYDAEGGSKVEKESSSVQAQYKENPFQTIAVNASNKIFNKKPEMYFNASGISSFTERELGDAVKNEKEKRENLIIVRGKAKDPELKIGGRVKLKDINGKAMETYRVMEVKHYHDGNNYYNEFIGIPDVFTPPYQSDEALPFGEEQSAKVMDNDDPMGMGRVKVQFPWQEKKSQQTPWLRLIQPHSGSGKGFHFIPEIGEEVLVGFESANAEKPFVMGTHYNGSETSSYHTAGNDKKVIHTRSGTKIILNDSEGSVFIEDPSGNTYLMDGAGNINVNAPNDITFTAGKNMNINVGQNMTTTVGMNSSETIGMNKSVGVGMINMVNVGTDFITNVVGKMTEYVKGSIESHTEEERKMHSKSMGINSEATIQANASEKMLRFSGEKSNDA